MTLFIPGIVFLLFALWINYNSDLDINPIRLSIFVVIWLIASAGCYMLERRLMRK